MLSGFPLPQLTWTAALDILIVAFALMVALYVGDDLSVRYRIPKSRQPFGTVTIRRFGSSEIIVPTSPVSNVLSRSHAGLANPTTIRIRHVI